MRGAFASRLARTVTVTDAAGSREARAFLQPFSVKEPEGPAITAAGVADPRRWLLILDAAGLSGPAVEIADGQKRYALLRWEEIGGHIEGVLCRKEDADNA